MITRELITSSGTKTSQENFALAVAIAQCDWDLICKPAVLSLVEFTSFVGNRSKSSNESPAFCKSLTGLCSGDSSGLVTGLGPSDKASVE